MNFMYPFANPSHLTPSLKRSGGEGNFPLTNSTAREKPSGLTVALLVIVRVWVTYPVWLKRGGSNCIHAFWGQVEEDV